MPLGVAFGRRATATRRAPWGVSRSDEPVRRFGRKILFCTGSKILGTLCQKKHGRSARAAKVLATDPNGGETNGSLAEDCAVSGCVEQADGRSYCASMNALAPAPHRAS